MNSLYILLSYTTPGDAEVTLKAHAEKGAFINITENRFETLPFTKGVLYRIEPRPEDGSELRVTFSGPEKGALDVDVYAEINEISQR